MNAKDFPFLRSRCPIVLFQNLLINKLVLDLCWAADSEGEKFSLSVELVAFLLYPCWYYYDSHLLLVISDCSIFVSLNRL